MPELNKKKLKEMLTKLKDTNRSRVEIIFEDLFVGKVDEDKANHLVNGQIRDTALLCGFNTVSLVRETEFRRRIIFTR